MLFLLACHGPPTTSPPDSADSDTPVEIVEQPGLHLGGVVTCEDPTLRDTEGPMLQPDLGAAWADQPSKRSGFGAAVEDFNADGLIDIFLPDHDGCTLFLAQSDGTFARLPDATPEGCAGMGAAPADIDADGDLDLIVATIDTPEILLINDGTGHFNDEAEVRGLYAKLLDPTMGASWGDYDGDGDLDLFMANHSFRGESGSVPPAPGIPTRLMRNDGSGFFSDVSDAVLSEAARLGYSFLGGWHDLDADGNEDLYIVNDFGNRVFPNILLLGDGAGGLTEADPATGIVLGIDAMGLAVGDLTGDGLPDLAISDWGALHLMLSLEPGVWYDSALACGVTPAHADQVVGWAMEFADLDNDTDLDLVATFGPSPQELADATKYENPDFQPDGLWLNDGGAFTESSVAWGMDITTNNRGLVIADLNGDGWPDTLRRGILDDDTLIHHSRCGAAAWLGVRLEGIGENPAGIGARIEAWSGDVRQVRWIRSGSTGLASGGPLVAHFGLGEADVLDRLDVFWPSGTTSSFTDIETRQSVVISQTDSEE